MRTILARLSKAMDDANQVCSTRRISKILNKLTTDEETIATQGGFIEKCARFIDLDGIQQTTPIVQT